ncbi:MAG: septum formation initiator family protein [Proteobacteria bacterium]|nr:septum formation initiator family protein [Pseudomonadota bacterium]
MKWLNTTLLILILIALYLRWFGTGGINDLTEKNLQLEAQKIEIRSLEERNALLVAEVFDLTNGLEAIEERARSELGMIKEGETFIQVINEAQQQNEQ